MWICSDVTDLENPGASMKEDEYVEDVAEFVCDPKRAEDVCARRLSRKHVNNRQNDDQQHSSET